MRSELAWLDTVVTGLADVGNAHQRIRAALAVEPKELVLGPVAVAPTATSARRARRRWLRSARRWTRSGTSS